MDSERFKNTLKTYNSSNSKFNTDALTRSREPSSSITIKDM